jgi:hypothetical protein
MTATTRHYEGTAQLIADDGTPLGTVRVQLHKTPPAGARLGHWEGTLVPDPTAADAPTRLEPGQVTLRLASGRSAFAVLKSVPIQLDAGKPVNLVGSGPPPF